MTLPYFQPGDGKNPSQNELSGENPSGENPSKVSCGENPSPYFGACGENPSLFSGLWRKPLNLKSPHFLFNPIFLFNLYSSTPLYILFSGLWIGTLTF